MKQALLIARRELFAYIRSPLGAIIIAGAPPPGLPSCSTGPGSARASLRPKVLQLFFYNTSGVTMAAALFLSACACSPRSGRRAR